MKGSAIGVLVHPRRDSRDLVELIVEWAAGHGKAVHGMEEARHLLPPSVQTVADDELGGDDTSLVIAAGGDGTILRGLRLAHPYGIPVLGVNLGRLAFLAEVQYDDLAASLDAIDRDEFRVEERSTMSVSGDGIDGLPLTVFNDAAITRVAGHGPAALAVEVEGDVFGRYTADALVIATPTGSTGYSFSAGGPIVSPRHTGLLVTPVAPHAAFDRAVFLHPGESLRVHVLERSAPLLVEADGQRAAELGPGQSIAFCVGERPAQVLRLHAHGFYERARRKLQLVDSSELAPPAHPV
jgi:NAD+ kinase